MPQYQRRQVILSCSCLFCTQGRANTLCDQSQSDSQVQLCAPAHEETCVFIVHIAPELLNGMPEGLMAAASFPDVRPCVHSCSTFVARMLASGTSLFRPRLRVPQAFNSVCSNASEIGYVGPNASQFIPCCHAGEEEAAACCRCLLHSTTLTQTLYKTMPLSIHVCTFTGNVRWPC